MKRTLITLVMISMGVMLFATNGDEDAVKNAINKSYIEAIHNLKELNNIENGFHPSFELLGLREGELTKYTIDRWKKATEQRAQRTSNEVIETTARFPMIDITGDAAVVKVELYKDNNLVSSQYISLYRFADGWKIVSEIFQRN